MKTKLVLWGTNENEEKVLIALELRPSESKVNVYTFPEALATEEFGKKMFDEWRNGQAVLFPEGYQTMERELSLTESLLPDTLKVDRGDVIQRAQTEWQFVVLSEKLNQVYKTELAELKEKIEQLTDYDSKTWEALKTFWSKVQGQVRERNLFREHANSLRENTNELFSKMKEMRATLNKEFESVSQTHFETFKSKLTEVEEKVTKGMNLSNIFNELKDIQKQFRDTKFTKDHRAKVWNKLDGLFKTVKEKKFGPEAAGGNSPGDRLSKRYDGLMNAIGRMENSIGRDRNDLKYEGRKIANSEGQLEAQIRQAKIKMIEERIRSKEEKLADMHRTREELEKKKEAQKEKDKRRAEQQKIKDAKEAAKAKIKEEMKAAETARAAQGEKLEAAADAIKGKASEVKTDAEDILDTVTETANEVADQIRDTFEDAVDTVKAIAEVLGGKINQKATEVQEMANEAKEKAQEKIVEVQEKAKEAAVEVQEKATEAKEKAQEKITEVQEKAKETAAEMQEKAAEAKETIQEKATEAKEKAQEKIADVQEKATEIKETAQEKIQEVAADAEEEIEEIDIVDTTDAVSLVSPVAAKTERPDDLKIIEGIGPKIEEILQNVGIKTWEQLSKTAPTQLSGILLAAGSRYKSKNPSTWPKQARMAAAGQWDELKAWQEELDGGIDRKAQRRAEEE